MKDITDIPPADVIYWELKLRGPISGANTKEMYEGLRERASSNGISFTNTQQMAGSVSRGRRLGWLAFDLEQDGCSTLSVGEERNCPNPFELVQDEPLRLVVSKSYPKQKVAVPKAATVDDKYAFLRQWSTTEMLELIAYASDVVKKDIASFKKGVMESL